MNLWIRFETKFRRALTFKPRKASRAPHGRVSNDNHRGGRRPFHYASNRPGAGTESRKQSIDWLSLVSGKHSKLCSYQSR
jgi:hypothetical protein